MENGAFVEIEYTGRIKETGEIFDLTDEKTAKENKIYSPKKKYGPATIIIGENMILKGVEETLKTMKHGDTKKITLNPEQAFGKRDPNRLKVFALSHFQKQKIYPVVGQFITLANDVSGKVISVSAGRVKMDFNHPLSGKTLEYDLKLDTEIKDPVKKIEFMLTRLLGYDKKDKGIAISGEKAEISLPNAAKLSGEIKSKITEQLKKYIPEIKEIEISYKNPKVANTTQ